MKPVIGYKNWQLAINSSYLLYSLGDIGGPGDVRHVSRLEQCQLVGEGVEVELDAGRGTEGDDSHATDSRTVTGAVNVHVLNDGSDK